MLTEEQAALTDAQLERYSRQLLLPEVDIAGQQALRAARVLIVGAGGLGHPAALYLAAAGVGELLLMDDDRVERSNLARQVGFRDTQLGQLKVEALADTLAAINPDCKVFPLAQRFAEKAPVLTNAQAPVQLVLDCTDNFATRFAINAACVAAAVPLISGAAIRLSGQVACFDPAQPDAGCYRCLFADIGEDELRCSEAGVLGPLVGMIGSFQALLALRYLTSGSLPANFWQFDASHWQWRKLQLKRDPACPVCGNR